eukprot:CAMPEP_0171293310 /NCGR_PEP_ID=MMETSP0816-20121228/1488_1 /TAXON_ID=420281 /ORGANISM="Proboscia inermis, Strain CCAP1064/1" /LENGTH=211 /DNA_ID=CAMNT_0011763991 /DNA_START=29 /DNA_END=664 /DNA_ORIENTATION=-
MSMEEYLGDTLVMPDGSKHKTAIVLNNCDIVALYFSASWCGPCQSFTPQLVDFYKNAAKNKSVQIIFISSDRDQASFMEYFKKMPWFAMPFDASQIKNKLSQTFQIRGIPSLIVLDGKSGNFITSDGRNDVIGVRGDEAKGKELVQIWKSKEAVPLHEANLSGDQGPWYMVWLKSVLGNPIYLIGIYYMIKSALAKLNEMGKVDSGENQDL